MAQILDPVRCIRCTTEKTRAAALPWAVAINGGPVSYVCSTGCREALTVAASTANICLNCNGSFPRAEVGRPRLYCGEKCRREREKAYARAMRRLARGPGGDPARPNDEANPQRWGDYVRRLELALAEMSMLLDRLRDRDPRTGFPYLDEASLPSPATLILKQACAAEINRLVEMLSQARRSQMHASAGEHWSSAPSPVMDWLAKRRQLVADELAVAGAAAEKAGG